MLIICLLILSNIFKPKDNSDEAGIHFKDANGILAEPQDTIDVLVVGNSEACTSIIPTEIWKDYGYTCYVCASADQTLQQCIDFIHKACERQKPKIIILEANNAFKTTKISDTIDQVLHHYLKVFQYHNRWKYLTGKDFKRPKYKTLNYLKGYKYSNEVKGVSNNGNIVEADGTTGIPISNKLYMKYINDFCEERDIKFIAISTPIKKFWSNSNHILLEDFFEKNEIEFIDFNMHENEIGIDWNTDTKDGGDHLNYSGALKATKFLGKLLSKQNILSSHKEDEKYNLWNQSYEKYRKFIEKNTYKNL